MEHLSDTQLLEALEQPHTRASGFTEHLSGCASCRQRWIALQETWDVLGQWTVAEPDIDLTERILQKARPVRPVYLWQARTLIRIAASIIIGMGLGAILARPKPVPVSDRQVAQSMYLDVLALDSSTGWTGPLLSESEEP